MNICYVTNLQSIDLNVDILTNTENIDVRKLNDVIFVWDKKGPCIVVSEKEIAFKYPLIRIKKCTSQEGFLL